MFSRNGLDFYKTVIRLISKFMMREFLVCETTKTHVNYYTASGNLKDLLQFIDIYVSIPIEELQSFKTQNGITFKQDKFIYMLHFEDFKKFLSTITKSDDEDTCLMLKSKHGESRGKEDFLRVVAKVTESTSAIEMPIPIKLDFDQVNSRPEPKPLVNSTVLRKMALVVS